MRESYFHIVLDNNVVLSNLPESLLPEVETCTAATQCKQCPINGRQKRQKKLPIENGSGFVYLCSYDNEINKKVFADYFDAILSLYSSFVDRVYQVEIKNKESAKADIHRLQHNVNSYNAKIQDDLESLIAIQDTEMKDWISIVQNTTRIVKKNPKRAALVLLKTIKNISLVNAEMNVYDFLENPNSEIQFFEHPIHKVIKLSLQPFFLDFIENKIRISLGECRSSVLIDYSSISVVLGHLWSNAIKYTCRDADINISFSEDSKHVYVQIETYSIAIEPGEETRIMQEGYSGKWSKAINKSGNGIGMYYINYLTELNRGQFKVIPGQPSARVNGVPYANNTFILTLNKINHG